MILKTKMQAAVFSGPAGIEVQYVAKPVPGPREVLVRLEGCGVCASNVPVWEGRPWFDYPLEAGNPGHEGWGRVEATGAEVREVTEGMRVSLLSSRAFAEYDVACEEAVVPLPSQLDGIPFPGEALGCAMNVFERSGIERGQTVAIVGVGFLGLVLASLATQAGARVLCLSRRSCALDLASHFGADSAIRMDDHREAVEAVGAKTGGEGCDVVVEAAGAQWPLDLASELVKVRGRLIIAGYHQDGPRQVNMQAWNWKGLDVINAHERDSRVYVHGIRQAIAAVVRGAFEPDALFTHPFTLTQLPEAFDHMASKPEGFVKAYVQFAGGGGE